VSRFEHSLCQYEQQNSLCTLQKRAFHVLLLAMQTTHNQGGGTCASRPFFASSSYMPVMWSAFLLWRTIIASSLFVPQV